MKICLAISSLFNSGGLQRDCLHIAELLIGRGHDVTIMTARQIGDVDTRATIEIMPVGVRTNPGRDRALGERVARARERYDRVVGFNKMDGLDFYYAGDPPYRSYKPQHWRRFSPRFQAQQANEALVFAPNRPTRIIALAASQADLYRRQWNTGPDRIQVIGPTLDPSRQRPDLRASEARAVIRQEFGIGENEIIALSIGASARVKGLDRAAAALSAVSAIRWLVVGARPGSAEERRLRATIAYRRLGARAILAGIRTDIPAIMAASDFLLHPARLENTGTVIIEALANGLPAIVSSACGYARHVTESGGGLVVANVDDPQVWRAAIVEAQDARNRLRWSEKAIAACRSKPLSGGLEEACDIICA